MKLKKLRDLTCKEYMNVLEVIDKNGDIDVINYAKVIHGVDISRIKASAVSLQLHFGLLFLPDNGEKQKGFKYVSDLPKPNYNKKKLLTLWKVQAFEKFAKDANNIVELFVFSYTLYHDESYDYEELTDEYFKNMDKNYLNICSHGSFFLNKFHRTLKRKIKPFQVFKAVFKMLRQV